MRVGPVAGQRDVDVLGDVGGHVLHRSMDDDLALIDLASKFYKFEGVREAAARELGWTPGRFWQRVAWLTTQPEVVAVRAGECRRLVGLAEARRAVRTSVSPI